MTIETKNRQFFINESVSKLNVNDIRVWNYSELPVIFQEYAHRMYCRTSNNFFDYYYILRKLISFQMYISDICVYDWATFLLLLLFVYTNNQSFFAKMSSIFKWAEKMPHFFLFLPFLLFPYALGRCCFARRNKQTNKNINFPFQLDGNGQFFGIICKHATLFLYFLSIALIVTLAK